MKKHFWILMEWSACFVCFTFYFDFFKVNNVVVVCEKIKKHKKNFY